MSMLRSFFNKGFVASKCKTLLKLTIPRIKLLRNKKEIQLKQTRRDVAKLLETGQEATARIRVEHILREENMMASQEIIELFCELIVVRLPIIESQRECPLDLKEAISSLCFAAPRCADLPELLQVQQLFASKYGKEFVSAATELVPDCGVNPQLIERLSVRAPSPEKKLKLLKEIATEHELDWDPADSETEFFKKQEDLLNGPLEFFSASNSPLPEKKHNEASYSTYQPNKEPDSDSGSVSDTLEFPEVPNVPVQSNVNVATAPEMVTPPGFSHCEVDFHSSSHSGVIGDVKREQVERSIIDKDEPQTSGRMENKQFVPFISTTVSPASFSARHCGSPCSLVRKKSEADVDLQDVLAAAHATAEHATVAAQSAASLAQMRINEVTKNNSECEPNSIFENPFYTDNVNWSATTERGHFTEKNIAGGYDDNRINDLGLHQVYNAAAATQPTSSLAQVRNSKLTKNNSECDPNSTYENPFYTGSSNQFATTEMGHFIEKNTVGDHDNAAVATRSTTSIAQGHISELTKEDTECDLVDTFENPLYTGNKNRSTTTERGHFIEKNTTGDYDSNHMNDLKLHQDYNAAVAAPSTTSLAQVCNSELTKKNSECKPDSTYENPFYAGSADQFATIGREHFTEKDIVGDYDNATGSLVQRHISELTKKNSECDPNGTSENPFYTSSVNRYATTERGYFIEKNIVGNHNGRMNDLEPYKDYNAYPGSQSSSLPSFDTTKADFDYNLPNYQVLDDKSSSLRPKNLPSMDDDLYSSYPNLFNFPNSNVGS